MLQLRLSVVLVMCVAVLLCAAEPPSRRFRFPGSANVRPVEFLARQEDAAAATGPYPASVSGPYPAAGQQPDPPFELPDRYGPPSTPAPSYGPPPAEPEQVYGPPQEPELAYGPPGAEPEPELTYGPPDQTYGPPEAEPETVYGPPAPAPSYGPPPQREPHDTYGPPPQLQPQPQPIPAEDNGALPQSASILAQPPSPPLSYLTLPRPERLVAFRPARLRRPASLRRRPLIPKPEKLIARPQFQPQQQGFAQLPPSNRNRVFRP